MASSKDATVATIGTTILLFFSSLHGVDRQRLGFPATLSISDPLLYLSIRGKGTEPESLFPSKFNVLRFVSSARNSGTGPVKPLFAKSRCCGNLRLDRDEDMDPYFLASDEELAFKIFRPQRCERFWTIFSCLPPRCSVLPRDR
uniref:Senescence-induced receptor-like serine/threonine-protein kinase isoform X1 n=1 Tax=Rhizophora mucronata TaxID=61149 RepID=A0A2P2MWY4_RHIMU